MSVSKPDDLEAVRTVVDAVKEFPVEDQQRIFRWAAEKLGLTMASAPAHTPPPVSPDAHPHAPAAPSPSGGMATDIKTFMLEKKPRNAVQYAAAVAYYYRFEAPPAEKKQVIDKDDLQQATRKSGRDRFENPLQTLNNAHTLGLLDRGPEKGTFVVNSVGENLVAMTLPDGTPQKKSVSKKAIKKTKKSAKKA
jgi:hypothetical protein